MIRSGRRSAPSGRRGSEADGGRGRSRREGSTISSVAQAWTEHQPRSVREWTNCKRRAAGISRGAALERSEARSSVTRPELAASWRVRLRTLEAPPPPLNAQREPGRLRAKLARVRRPGGDGVGSRRAGGEGRDLACTRELRAMGRERAAPRRWPLNVEGTDRGRVGIARQPGRRRPAQEGLLHRDGLRPAPQTSTAESLAR